jgi:hypothetical protein
VSQALRDFAGLQRLPLVTYTPVGWSHGLSKDQRNRTEIQAQHGLTSALSIVGELSFRGSIKSRKVAAI